MRTGMMDVPTRNGAVVRVGVTASGSELTIFSPSKDRVITVDLRDEELEDLARVVQWATEMRGL
jgi:hypothetical protein